MVDLLLAYLNSIFHAESLSNALHCHVLKGAPNISQAKASSAWIGESCVHLAFADILQALLRKREETVPYHQVFDRLLGKPDDERRRGGALLHATILNKDSVDAGSSWENGLGGEGELFCIQAAAAVVHVQRQRTEVSSRPDG